MSCSNVVLTVLNGSSNTETIVIGEKTNGIVSAFDFTTTTRIVLEFYDSTDTLIATVDSDTSPTAIDWSASPTEGEVVLDLGGEGIAADDYHVRLIQYSPTKPAGEIVYVTDELYSFDVEVRNV